MTTPTFPDRFNLAAYLIDHALQDRPDAVALRWRDEEHTYAGLAAASARLAHGFLELGLRMEERVLIAASDRPEWAWAFLATLRCGAVFTMVNTVLKDEDYLYYLEYTRARIAVVDAELAGRFEALRARAPHLRAIVVAGGGTSAARPQTPDGQHAVLDLVEGAPSDEPPRADTHRHDVAGWLFTSGSTGRPKGVVHFHEDFAFNVETYARQVLGIGPDDVSLGVPKLFFGYATGNTLMFPLAVGASTALFSERSTPETMFETIARYRPTILTSVPTMIGRMLEVDEQSGPYDLSSLRLVTSAGEKLPETLHRRWLERFSVEILDGIGSAELFHVHISNRPGAVRMGSLGQVVPGYEARVVDEQGHEVPDGEPGRLHVRGESAGLCYWQAHEKSKRTFAGDLVVTGDVFRRDADGYFFYAGRADELLKVGGVWVAPTEIEECLVAHEAVAEAAVVGWRDEDDLVKPKAFVVPAPGHPADEALAGALQEWVKTRLAPYKYPRFVEFLDEMPTNDRGKTNRLALRERQAPA